MFEWLKPKTHKDGAGNDDRSTPSAKSTRADLLWRQGIRLLERRKFAQALVSMRKAMELEPSRLDGRLNMGAALYLSGHLDEAITHLKYVLAFEPQNTMALLNLSACYDGLGRLGESVSTLEAIVADRPSWKDAHYNLGVAYYKQKKYQSAIDALKAELKLNPEHEAARTLLHKISLFAPQNPKPENLSAEKGAQ